VSDEVDKNKIVDGNGKEIKPDNPIPEPEKAEQPKDFKIAEIWIKSDQIALDAVPNFWMDKLRAIGILEYCKEIVKDYNPKDNTLVKPVDKQGFKKFINRIKRR
jgi:hypothetical protein